MHGKDPNDIYSSKLRNTQLLCIVLYFVLVIYNTCAIKYVFFMYCNSYFS